MPRIKHTALCMCDTLITRPIVDCVCGAFFFHFNQFLSYQSYGNHYFLWRNSWIFIHSNIASDVSSITLFIQLTFFVDVVVGKAKWRENLLNTSNTLTSYHQFHFIIRICVVFVFISSFPSALWTINWKFVSVKNSRQQCVVVFSIKKRKIKP